jgi:RimJ/RimL family protein N-acetyltransferase
MPGMTHPLWPLFDLSIRSARLELRLPTDAELVELAALAKAGIHPPDEMPFAVAWSTQPSPQFERNFVKHHWAMRAEWSPDHWTLNLGTFLHGRLIGSQGFTGHRFAVYRTIATGSWLGQPYQGQGYGKEMRGAVLAFAFDHLGALRAESDAFLSNPQSNGVSRSLGYVENGLAWAAPEDRPVPTQRFLMTLDQWRSRPRDRIEVTGLDACRDLFGLPANAPDISAG